MLKAERDLRKLAFDSLPATERQATLARIERLLIEAQWVFAKTYALTNPHWYTLRRSWADSEAFTWVAAHIQVHGYSHRFGRSYYRQLDIEAGGFFVWTMGDPPEKTILINRKPLP